MNESFFYGWMKLDDWGIKHFSIDEFKCKCCGKALMDRHFLYSLDTARSLAGIPFIIVSGYRCPQHNKSVGGARHSAHMDGYAVDIKVKNSVERFTILSALLRAGFKRIGIYKSWIHADMHPTLPQDVMWCA